MCKTFTSAFMVKENDFFPRKACITMSWPFLFISILISPSKIRSNFSFLLRSVCVFLCLERPINLMMIIAIRLAFLPFQPHSRAEQSQKVFFIFLFSLAASRIRRLQSFKANVSFHGRKRRTKNRKWSENGERLIREAAKSLKW